MSTFDDFMISEAVKKDASMDRLRQQRNELLECLRRIRAKADAGLREDGGRFAVQTLDAIDEIAEKAIAKAQGAA